VLVAIGVFLQTRSQWFDTNRLFTNVLAQIGLGYFFVFLLLGRSRRVQFGVAALVLIIYTLWLGTYRPPDPLPAESLQSIQSLSVPQHVAKHYAILTNAAAQTDMVILNLIPHGQPIQPHAAGYATLNFIPSAITMLIGVLAGTLLSSKQDDLTKFKHLVFAAAVCMFLAIIASYTVCPIIKKIWTPAWTMFSAAYVLWMLAAFFWIIDIKKWRGWTFPLVVVGTNSLAIYLMSMLSKPWISNRWENYFGSEIFAGPYGPLTQSVCVFATLWLVCLYLYRSKIFFRV
jgi:predicted acyltransferase